VRVRLEVAGDARALIDSLRRHGVACDAACKRVLSDAGDEAVRRAKPRTPVELEDGGQLRDSVRRGRVTRIKSGTISCPVIAGGKPVEDWVREHGHHKYNVYAVVQHEDTTLRHSVGQAKFIESAVFEVAPTIPDRLLAALPTEPS